MVDGGRRINRLNQKKKNQEMKPGDEARRADGNEIFEEAKVRRGELCDL